MQNFYFSWKLYETNSSCPVDEIILRFLLFYLLKLNILQKRYKVSQYLRKFNDFNM